MIFNQWLIELNNYWTDKINNLQLSETVKNNLKNQLTIYNNELTDLYYNYLDQLHSDKMINKIKTTLRGCFIYIGSKYGQEIEEVDIMDININFTDGLFLYKNLNYTYDSIYTLQQSNTNATLLTNVAYDNLKSEIQNAYNLDLSYLQNITDNLMKAQSDYIDHVLFVGPLTIHQVNGFDLNRQKELLLQLTNCLPVLEYLDIKIKGIRE